MKRSFVRSLCLFSIMALTAAALSPFAAAGSAPLKASAGAPAESQDFSHWFQKGALCATYGNNQAAVRYFAKAIALDPGHSGARFSQGVSYGQMKDYGAALAAIDRAIEMSPQNGLYYYGRARVYLLAGDKDRALIDFRKAADLGDEDAQGYLKGAK
jgi:tetratricopeptide (TPR) repeat protein